MKKVIVSIIIGLFFGALNFLLFTNFNSELYSNRKLLNTVLAIEIIIVFLATYFIFKRIKKDTKDR